ncbi:WbqC family protein [Spirosoma sp. KCTC 42546]|uniref:WbqC family protein n=1 Tax=Spirosoma sp. KCTC 42546 TaxID=2520506 RepID=UPI00115BA155|nr:WbqC family protein [Spirosoma sp. KCTC 42546]QDK79616.1 WbqC family protein [Spirosoma sp. KCTC 42546]
MTLAIMQPYFLPYIGYMQLMNAVDTFVLYDDVAFINRGWVNRNRLLINGQEHLFTVPLKDASQNKRINEVHLADDPKWRSKLLKTIEQGYRKAPCYQTVMPITEKIINFTTDSIADLIYFSLVELSQYMGITTRLVQSSTIYANGELKAQERILDICRQENAQRYINPIGGIELYDKPTFAQAGIELNFIKSTKVDYTQFNRGDGRNEFVPWLSIIDILMFNDIATVRTMLDAYELV